MRSRYGKGRERIAEYFDKREVLEGELSDPRQVVLPAVAASGGMAVPAAVYAAINAGIPVALAGWAIPAATDIVLALGMLSLLGNRVPEGADWGATFGASVPCGIGFTMSLFIAGLACEGAGSEYLVQTRRGVLFGSLASAVLGLALLHVMRPRAATNR